MSIKEKLKEAIEAVDLIPEGIDGLEDKELEELMVLTARLEKRARDANGMCGEYAATKASMPALKRELLSIEAAENPDPAALRSVRKAIVALLRSEFVPVLQAAKSKREAFLRTIRDSEDRARKAQEAVKQLDAKLTDAVVKRVSASGLPMQEVVRIFGKVMGGLPRGDMNKVLERAEMILHPQLARDRILKSTAEEENSAWD